MLAVRLLGLALIALIAAAGYTLRVNPEVRLYRHAVQLKRAWALQMPRESGPRFILAGGSSAAFSVDGEILRREYGIRLLNFGLHAGMGPPFLTAVAAREARPGDTLIVAMEPALLTVPFTSPDLAAQMGFALGEPDLIHATAISGDQIHWIEDLASLRPGAYHVFTLLGKVVLRKPLYRYAARDLHDSGWQEARDFREVKPQSPVSDRLSSDADRLFESVIRWGRANQVELRYSLPWTYVPAESSGPQLRSNAAFLARVSRYLPVLKDPTLGIHTAPAHFADTEWHLTKEGARLRTESLAIQLRSGATWTTAELEGLAREPLAVP